jgi:hypothetical protein
MASIIVLINMEQDALCQRDGRKHVSDLASKPTFSEEVSLGQNAKACFLPGLGHHDKPNLPFLDKEQSVRRIALGEYHVFLLIRQQLPTFPSGREKGVGIEVTYFALGRDSVFQGTAFAGRMLVSLSAKDEAESGQ